MVGIKLYGIRRLTLLGKLGFQNGDLLRSVNGFDLSNPESLLDAYTKLRTLDHVSVVLTRRGEGRTLEYQVQ